MADRIIAPTIQESVKACVAKFNAEELITRRATAKAVIAESIANTLSARNIVVETVFITDFKFSQAFATQVESKVVAFQKFLTEQNNLKAIQVVANQTVVQAQAAARANVAKANGESQAIKIITVQLKESGVSSVAIHQPVERTNALCSWEWRVSFFPTNSTASIANSKSDPASS